MLVTAFGKQYRSGWPQSRIEAQATSQMKAWGYVGRFIWGFAMIENQANQLFLELIGGGPGAKQTGGVGLSGGLLLTYTLDLRKKLEVIEAILKSRGVDESKIFKLVHQLHDLRNPIVHFPWEVEFSGDRLSCDFISKHGHPGFKILGTSEYDNSITYAEFDSYDAIASQVYEKLYDLWNDAIPATEDELRHVIEKAIDSSDNVVRFPEKPRVDDED